MEDRGGRVTINLTGFGSGDRIENDGTETDGAGTGVTETRGTATRSNAVGLNAARGLFFALACIKTVPQPMTAIRNTMPKNVLPPELERDGVIRSLCGSVVNDLVVLNTNFGEMARRTRLI